MYIKKQQRATSSFDGLIELVGYRNTRNQITTVNYSIISEIGQIIGATEKGENVKITLIHELTNQRQRQINTSISINDDDATINLTQNM